MGTFTKLKFDCPEYVFWFGLILLILLKLVLTSGGVVQMVYSPHDDGLYVSRAFHLLTDGGLGPYDARLLVKVPGISLWLAGVRFLGIPYLFSINLLYVLAGVYFITALKQCKVNRVLLLLVFALYLFNPVTIDHQWFRVMRESLSISLLVLMLGSMVFVLAHLSEERLPVIHWIFLAFVFAFAVLVREEDRLLYGLLAMFMAVVLWQLWPRLRSRKWMSRLGLLVMIGAPFIFSFTGNLVMRAYVERHYGAPLLYDFGEGEFPRLMAAIRSVESHKDNRRVMVTQEALAKLRIAVPSFVPVIDRLPLPAPTSYSCERYKVCSEWTNGWMLFWVKDAAFQAGLTPTLPAGQAYFRSVRLEIENACKEGKLKCSDKGSGLMPPMELRWTRAFLQEAVGIIRMMVMPGFGLAGVPPETYPVDVDYGRMYQMVTMSHHYDSERQVYNMNEAWKNQPNDLYLSLKYWLRYPDIAVNNDFGPRAGGDPLGAAVHYQRHGQHEGRLWLEGAAQKNSASGYVSPLEQLKPMILQFFGNISYALEFAGMLALLMRIGLWRKIPPSPVAWVSVLVVAFTAVRVLAMSYLSVYIGGLDARLFFSTYVAILLISPLIIADVVKALCLYRKMSAR